MLRRLSGHDWAFGADGLAVVWPAPAAARPAVAAPQPLVQRVGTPSASSAGARAPGVLLAAVVSLTALSASATGVTRQTPGPRGL